MILPVDNLVDYNLYYYLHQITMWRYTWTRMTQVVRWTTWPCVSTNKANRTYEPSITQKRIPIMIITGDHFDSYKNIVLNIISRLPPSWISTFFVYRCGNT